MKHVSKRKQAAADSEPRPEPRFRPGRRGLLTLILSAGSLLAGCTGAALVNGLTLPVRHQATRGIVYDASHQLALDVYAPRQAKGVPVVVFFHGGRWSFGSKDEYRFVGGALANQGFVAVLPDYRHYPAVRYPAFVEDSALAVRWAHEHAREFGGDPDHLFVMGHSAGAYNAAMLALDEHWLQAVGGSRQWLSGMVGLAGPYDFLPLTDADLQDIFGPPSQYAVTQPINHVDGRNPPLLLLHGNADTTVKPRNTVNLAARVIAAGGQATTVLYPDMKHIGIVAVLASLLQWQTPVMTEVTGFMHTHSTEK